MFRRRHRLIQARIKLVAPSRRRSRTHLVNRRIAVGNGRPLRMRSGNLGPSPHRFPLRPCVLHLPVPLTRSGQLQMGACAIPGGAARGRRALREVGNRSGAASAACRRLCIQPVTLISAQPNRGALLLQEIRPLDLGAQDRAGCRDRKARRAPTVTLCSSA